MFHQSKRILVLLFCASTSILGYSYDRIKYDYNKLEDCALKVVSQKMKAASLYEKYTGPDEITILDQNVQADIVIPQNADSSEILSANELAYWLGKITDKKFNIVRDAFASHSKPLICIGKTVFLTDALKEMINKLKSDDSYTIISEKNRLIIAGKAGYGNYFGVVDFLERFMDIRFFMPAEFGVDLLKKEKIVFPKFLFVFTPSFKVRGFGLYAPDLSPEKIEMGKEWLIRNKFNSAIGRGRKLSVLGGGLLGGFTKTHSFDVLSSPDKFSKSYPDWFPYIKSMDRRDTSGAYVQRCVSNPEFINHIASQAMNYFKTHPRDSIFCIGPNDNWHWCECEKCCVWDNQRGQADWEDVPSEPIISDRVWRYVNEVAKIVKDKFPDKIIYSPAYHNYTRAPSFPLQDNVLVQLCHHRPACYSYSIASCDCEKNKHFKKIFEEWRKKNVKIYIYYYTFKTMFRQLPWPVAEITAKNMNYFNKPEVLGVYGQSSISNFGYNGLNYWVFAKTSWDAALEPNAIIKDYFTRYYGPMAEEMMLYYYFLEEALRESKTHIISQTIMNESDNWLSYELLKKARIFLNKAQNKSAKQDEKYLQRLNLAIQAHEYAEQYLKLDMLSRAYNKTHEIQKAEEAYSASQNLLKEAEKNMGNWGLMYSGSEGISGFVKDKIQNNLGNLIKQAKFEKATLKDLTGEMWTFMLDPKNIGEGAGYNQVNFDDSSWKKIAIGKTWESEGYDYDGIAWYRISFKTSKDCEGKSIILSMPGVDGEAWVWINGKFLIHNVGWDKPIYAEIDKYLDYNLPNILTVKVYDKMGAGGIYKPVRLVETPRKSKSVDNKN
ncbi:MAG: hypothetical protein A2017_21905 [Lentisphaerae bacterium GWF2_44_16]|nr:MAG: hypothetical protein A2017_21905 [Lentisphaerae bacterium GWF2_44_16]